MPEEILEWSSYNFVLFILWVLGWCRSSRFGIHRECEMTDERRHLVIRTYEEASRWVRRSLLWSNQIKYIQLLYTRLFI